METSSPIELSIRRAGPGDEDALALIGRATFLETFAGILDGAAIIEHCRRAHASGQYAAWLQDQRCALWLAEALPGGAPVGYAVVAPADLPSADPERDLELKRIYLLGRCQGGGVGRRLLEQAVAHATNAGAARLLLGVYAGNRPAQEFYRRQGFAYLATRTFHVGGKGYDDHVMGRVLEADPLRGATGPHAARRHDIGARSMHAMKSRAEIDATVARLADRLQELCSQLPPAQVLEAFSRETAPLTEHVAAEHEAYVEERIHALLSEAGLMPDDSPGG